MTATRGLLVGRAPAAHSRSESREHRVEQRHRLAAAAQVRRGVERAERRDTAAAPPQLGIEAQVVRLPEKHVRHRRPASLTNCSKHVIAERLNGGHGDKRASSRGDRAANDCRQPLPARFEVRRREQHADAVDRSQRELAAERGATSADAVVEGRHVNARDRHQHRHRPLPAAAPGSRRPVAVKYSVFERARAAHQPENHRAAGPQVVAAPARRAARGTRRS